MNDFMTLAKSRYSVRSYQSRPVEQEKIEKILEAARIAPPPATISRKRFTSSPVRKGARPWPR